ncbi:protein draper-like [Saccostrea cucullata]|uniref:protein draper-like n=1 Tax=Saccostrea cuccullata TaxID=36930 RepID=UPI002ED1DDB9
MEFLILLLFMHTFSTNAYDNLSEGRSCIQSSTWTCVPSCHLYAANNAVDGDMNTCMRSKPIGSSFPDKTVWWRVDLGDIKSIYSIRIQFRDYGKQYYHRQRGRLGGFSLYISNTTEIQWSNICYRNGPELPPLDFINICTIYGRYVTFYNERNGTTYPTGYETSIVLTELCEVIVTGCHKDGFYGQNCDLTCPLHCQDRRCHITNGTCLGCTAGWIGEFCNKTCNEGWYGDKCSRHCSFNCQRGVCHNVHGECSYGCKPGWKGSNCSQLQCVYT